MQSFVGIEGTYSPEYFAQQNFSMAGTIRQRRSRSRARSDFRGTPGRAPQRRQRPASLQVAGSARPRRSALQPAHRRLRRLRRSQGRPVRRARHRSASRAPTSRARPLQNGGYGDAAGQVFQSEMAALSFNMQSLLVAFSVPSAAAAATGIIEPGRARRGESLQPRAEPVLVRAAAVLLEHASRSSRSAARSATRSAPAATAPTVAATSCGRAAARACSSTRSATCSASRPTSPRTSRSRTGASRRPGSPTTSTPTTTRSTGQRHVGHGQPDGLGGSPDLHQLPEPEPHLLLQLAGVLPVHHRLQGRLREQRSVQHARDLHDPDRLLPGPPAARHHLRLRPQLELRRDAPADHLPLHRELLGVGGHELLLRALGDGGHGDRAARRGRHRGGSHGVPGRRRERRSPSCASATRPTSASGTRSNGARFRCDRADARGRNGHRHAKPILPSRRSPA